MTLTRRGFLGALLAASAAPAVVKAESLMRLYVPPRLILFGDGVHDDTRALQALFNGGHVYTPGGLLLRGMPAGEFKLTGSLVVPSESRIEGCGQGTVLRQTAPGKPVLVLPTGTRNAVISNLMVIGSDCAPTVRMN